MEKIENRQNELTKEELRQQLGSYVPNYRFNEVFSLPVEDQKNLLSFYKGKFDHHFIDHAVWQRIGKGSQAFHDGELKIAKDLLISASSILKSKSEKTADEDVKKFLLDSAKVIDKLVKKRIDRKEAFDSSWVGKVYNYFKKRGEEKKEKARYENRKNGVVVLENKPYIDLFGSELNASVNMCRSKWWLKKLFDAGKEACEQGRHDMAKILLYDAYCQAEEINRDKFATHVKDENYFLMMQEIDKYMKRELSISAKEYRAQLEKAQEAEQAEFERRMKERQEQYEAEEKAKKYQVCDYIPEAQAKRAQNQLLDWSIKTLIKSIFFIKIMIKKTS